MVSGFTFKPLIYFEFIFVYGVRKQSSLVILHVAVQFSQHHLLKRLSFLHCIFLPLFLQNPVQSLCSVMSDSLQPCGLQAVRLHCPWDFPGNNTGVGCHFLLQEIFLIHGSNPCLPCRQTDALLMAIKMAFPGHKNVIFFLGPLFCSTDLFLCQYHTVLITIAL